MLLREKNKLNQIWKVYNELIGKAKSDKNKINSLLIDNEEISGKSNISNAFNEYFASIGNKLGENFTNNGEFKNYLNNPNLNSIYLETISEEEIKKEISKLVNKKTPGNDDIPAWLVKLSSNFIAQPLSWIFNKSIENGHVPSQLKISKIIPIYKKGDKKCPSNYRPISLLSIFNKILEKLIYKRLYEFLNKFNILYNYQFGFRRNHSTMLALTELSTKIRELTESNNYTIGIYLDLSKAFDTVNHDILIYKLNYYGIRGKALNWLISYLKNRQLTTYVNQTYSNLKISNIGVPQGSVLGPLLFLIYVNDIFKIIDPRSNEEIRLFADDTNIFITNNSLNQTFKQAQLTLNKISNWFKNNQLTLNIEKTSFSLFTNKTNVNNSNRLKVNGKEISQVHSTKYLGLYLDDQLKWTKHSLHVKNKLNQLTGALRYLTKFINNEQAKTIYYAYIHPHIQYGLENYGQSNLKNTKIIQTAQNKALKILFKKDPLFNTTELYRETQLLNVNSLKDHLTLKFEFKQRNNQTLLWPT